MSSEHPIHILASDGFLRPGNIQTLADNCTRSELHPDDDNLVIFTFAAADVNDSRDRIITADTASGRFRANRAEGCVCEDVREELDCDCHTLECTGCEERFIAIESTCEFMFCLYDECQYCTHQREDCLSNQVASQIRSAYRQELKEVEGVSRAEAAYSAIAETLGAGSGEAPNFPVARRSLSAMTGAEDTEGPWTFADQSVIDLDAANSAWFDLPKAPEKGSVPCPTA